MRMIRVALSVALLASVTACGGPRQEEEPAATGGETPAPAEDALPAPQPVEIPGIPNARQVGDLLFAGQPEPAAFATLAERGYRTVLTTRGEGELDWDEQARADSLGLAFVSIPMAYPIEAIPDEWVERFDTLMREGPLPAVLHCSSGNRVAGLWAVWLAERRGVDPARALELGAQAGMTRIRPVVEKRLGLSADAPAP